MNHFLPCVFAAASLIQFCSTVTGKTYYVIPTASTPCPEEGVPCCTLSEYATKSNNSVYFTLNTTLILLPGNHSLDSEFLIENITQLVITSNHWCSVFCTISGRFRFGGIEQVSVRDLSFFGCVNNSITSVDQFTLEDCTLHGQKHYGTGLQMTQIASADIIGVSFASFKAKQGGVITVVDSCNVTINSSLIEDNEAELTGGGMHVINADILINNCSFIGNVVNGSQSGRGGAVNAIRSNIVVNNSLFFNNTVNGFFGNGGAVYVSDSNVDMFDSNFSGNIAELGAAFAALFRSHVNLSCSTFVHNSGCAVTHFEGSNLSTTGFLDIQNNEAAAVYGIYSRIHFSGNVSLSHNPGSHSVCVLYPQDLRSFIIRLIHSDLSTSGSLNIQNNEGTAVYGRFSQIHFGGNVSLSCNNVNNNNNLINIRFSNLSTTGFFAIKNNVVESLSLVDFTDSTIHFNGYVSLSHNGGSVLPAVKHLIKLLDSNLSMSGILDIQGNEYNVLNGGDSVIDLRGNISLSHNNGGLVLYSCNVTISEVASIVNNSSPLAAYSSSSIAFVGDIRFMYNTGRDSQGMILLSDSRLYTYGNTTISNNMVSSSGGGIYAYRSELNFRGRTIFSGNKAGENGGGISTIAATINVYYGVLEFINNNAKKGGGLYLESDARIYLRAPLYSMGLVRLECTENSAEYGGAMYVNDANSGACASQFQRETLDSQPVDSECFFQTTLASDSSPFEGIFSPIIIDTKNTYFTNNGAKITGNVLYGGLLDRCTLNRQSVIYSLRNLLRAHGDFANPLTSLSSTHWTITNENPNRTDEISSKPVQVSFCTNGQQNETYTIYVRKGQTFKLPVVAVDQAGNPVEATIYSSTENGQLDRGQAVQRASATCTDLEYRIFGPNSNETLYLYADGPCNNVGLSRSSIDIQFMPCPIGFEESVNGCDCDSCLSSNMYISNCTIDETSVIRRDNIWIAIDDTSSLLEYVIHPNCPFDYCQPSTEKVFINLNSPNDSNGSDVQCAFNRSGKLCGSCKDGLSLSLGSSHCHLCSNSWIALFIVFALMGIAIVIFILTFNLTVAAGTINGLIFYANIISADSAGFLPFDSPNFLTIFVAWLNLDLGFETCFYDGLDGYAKTWLQFVFPAYVLFLVAMVILFASLSQRFSTLLSNRNPVAALATLILLSYTKLLRTVIAALSFARLEYYTADSKCERRINTVWLVDANIDYFKGKHIPLFIMAVAVIFVGLMFTFMLLLWHWLQRCPNKFCLRWIRNTKLNAFMDAYLAPYSRKYRFWPGLLLLVRVLLYLVLSAADGKNSVTLLMVVCLSSSLFYLKEYVRDRVYKNWLLNVLESSFIFNLGIFAISTGFIKQSGGNQKALAYTSTSIAFITFLAILVYHLFDSFKPLQNMANKIKEEQINKLVEKVKIKMGKIPNKLTENEQAVQLQGVNKVFFNELREPVLDDPIINSYHGDEKTSLPPKFRFIATCFRSNMHRD